MGHKTLQYTWDFSELVLSQLCVCEYGPQDPTIYLGLFSAGLESVVCMRVWATRSYNIPGTFQSWSWVSSVYAGLGHCTGPMRLSDAPGATCFTGCRSCFDNISPMNFLNLPLEQLKNYYKLIINCAGFVRQTCFSACKRS